MFRSKKQPEVANNSQEVTVVGVINTGAVTPIFYSDGEVFFKHVNEDTWLVFDRELDNPEQVSLPKELIRNLSTVLNSAVIGAVQLDNEYFFIGNIEDGVQYSFERAADKSKETIGIVCIDDPEDSFMVTEALGILANMGI